jgi:hypothetical protein
VCDVTQRDDGVSVTVAYGTSQALSRLHAGEFAITRAENPAAYATAGLSFDTKFDFRQAVELPWNEDFFAVPGRAPRDRLLQLHARGTRGDCPASDAVRAAQPIR